MCQKSICVLSFRMPLFPREFREGLRSYVTANHSQLNSETAVRELPFAHTCHIWHESGSKAWSCVLYWRSRAGLENVLTCIRLTSATWWSLQHIQTQNANQLCPWQLRSQIRIHLWDYWPPSLYLIEWMNEIHYSKINSFFISNLIWLHLLRSRSINDQAFEMNVQDRVIQSFMGVNKMVNGYQMSHFLHKSHILDSSKLPPFALMTALHTLGLLSVSFMR